ncbi:4-oxalocrotonate tautomerase DmpI [Alkaliphilus transvaalensis]|uniref:4-oxalocrotonate tautomerase DmpI n=1 Tax=Alkaliphilus transvaalensis TaxID=114628 RepID=UPI00047A89E7|nr:4-oxalocrotonate tautomerase DmpI [Alkaliphilus transvaalensis]
MPYISLDIGKLTTEQKNALIKAFTEATVEIAKVPPEAVLMMIKENELDNIGVGGISLAEKFGEKK